MPKISETNRDIREYLSYNPETGVFCWIRKPWRSQVRVGDVAGYRRSDGYRRITFRGRFYYAHHLAWFFVHGEMPSQIDHRNGVPGHDHINNLRLATSQQNNANRTVRPHSSRYKGVFFDKRAARWCAKVSVENKSKNLGLFKSEEAAARAYDAAALMHHGEFARLNFGPIA